MSSPLPVLMTWGEIIDVRTAIERAGIAESRIEAELRDFAQAVQNELIRRSRGLSRFDGGDAA